MNENITINLDNNIYAPISDLTLQELVDVLPWPGGDVTCATQERDGELLYWNCAIDEVKEARATASLDEGLMPLIGIGSQVHSEYSDMDNPVCAKDWETAVVSK